MQSAGLDVAKLADSLLLFQDEREFGALLGYVKKCRSILEIGSLFGRSIFRMAQCLPPNSKVVAVDWQQTMNVPGHKGIDSETPLRRHIEMIADMGHETHLILGDCRSERVIEAVRHIGPFDFVFIDGDHSYEGAKADWENYGAMAPMVAFHDISSDLGCADLWRELKARHAHVEFTDSGHYGIGLLVKETKEAMAA